jgi:hypothetical protein
MTLKDDPADNRNVETRLAPSATKAHQAQPPAKCRLVKTNPCLVPSSLNFGDVQTGEKVGGLAGVCNWNGSSHVTAAVENDNSGGRFSGFSLTIYDVEWGYPDPGDGNGGLRHPRPRWQLVEVATGDGSQPLTVEPGQTVGVSLFFTAPDWPTGKPFTADIRILSDGAVAATIPVAATVQAAPDVWPSWGLATPLGIEMRSFSSTDPLNGVFRAGHVNDVLVHKVSGALLAGTDAAGLWLLIPPGSSVGISGFGIGGSAAGPLTLSWDSNIVRCLCQGPDSPDHVYVGTDGVLFEIPYGNWRDISPSGVGNIFRIVVSVGSPRHVVVASSGGVFWSNVPQPGSAYQWNQVSRQTNGQPFPAGVYSGLATGPSGSIVVAAWGADAGSGHYGIFYGDWSSGDLVLTRSVLPASGGVPFGWGMGRTSLASSPQNPSVMYAVSAKTDGGNIYAVLASTDGGQTWSQRTIPSAPSANQGSYNNCISVSPSAASVVALGWQKHFVSRDGGQSWQLFDSHAGFTALHDDVHAVYFDPTRPPQERLYVCSDGGVALTTDGGQTFDSSLNRYLANLECYASIPRNFWGSLSVRGDILATGLQDNGNVYCARTSGQGHGPWVQVPDGTGDGGWVALIATGQLITNGGSSASWPRSDIPFNFDNEAPAASDRPVSVAAVPAGGIFAMEPILAPVYGNLSGQKMYAVGSQSQTVYGLFADSNGGNLHWEQVGTVTSDAASDSISVLAPLDDGTSVLVGTNAGRLFLLQPSTGGSTSGQKLAIFQGTANRMVFASPTLAFVTLNRGSSGALLRFDGTAWSSADSGLPEGPYYGLARDAYGRIWTCTDDRVFVSRDYGFTWKDASFGLPRRPHCADLRHNFAQQDSQELYLSTYGASVWVTTVPAKP